MKYIICGGRDFGKCEEEARVIIKVLTKIIVYDRDAFFISGGASGVDSSAETFAQAHGTPFAKVNANWRIYGKSAGPIRNLWMIRLQPDAVIAFPGGNGTADMVKRAQQAKVKAIILVDSDGNIDICNNEQEEEKSL